MVNNCTTIEELKAIAEVDDDDKDFCDRFSDFKGTQKLYGLHQFLDHKPTIKLLAVEIGNFPKVLEYVFDNIGVDLSDIGKPGPNHLDLIVTDDIGFIIHHTGFMNY